MVVTNLIYQREALDVILLDFPQDFEFLSENVETVAQITNQPVSVVIVYKKKY